MDYDLSIIIVSYKSKEHLKVLLPSIFASQTKYSFEVLVVDNDSGDGTVEWVKQYQISDINCQNLKVTQNINNGFAAGNNLGIKEAQGRYILLLNPDTKLEPSTLEVMIDFMESRPEVGISGCKVIKPNGVLDLACRRRFPNPWNAFLRLSKISNENYNYTNIDDNQEMEIDSVMGAFLLIRRSLVDKIGLLDEQFFMYGEDLDWCWRCKETGFKVWYYPETFITHYKGSSSRQAPFKSLKAFHNAMWIFYKKHYWEKYPLFLHWLVWTGIHVRLVLLAIVNLFKKERVVSK